MSHHASRSDTTDALYTGLIASYVFDAVMVLHASCRLALMCVPVILWTCMVSNRVISRSRVDTTVVPATQPGTAHVFVTLLLTACFESFV